MRTVTISIVTSRPPVADHHATSEQAVEQAIAHWRRRVSDVLANRPDIVVLPELCDRPAGGVAADEYYAVRGDRVRDALAELAHEHRCYLTYPALRVDADGRRRNSVQIIGRDGELVGTYDKNYPTIEEMDQKGISPGTEAPVFDLDVGSVACLVCFDLNFAELRERYTAAGPDLLLFCSAFHGGHLQTAWAYSAGAYLVSAVYPPAPSAIISPVGHLMAQTTNYHAEVTARVNLDRLVVHLDDHWDKLRALKQKYGTGVEILDPGLLGSALVTSETPERSMADLAAEFELTPTPAYLDRSRDHRDALVQGG